jgi:hypothetical protein
LASGALFALLMVTPALAADDSQEAWAALIQGGHVAVIRHGNAPPGHGGDPPGFRLGDCTTQRNLDDRGREQARALGEAFRARGVLVLVTHALTVRPLTGFLPDQAEMVVLKPAPGSSRGGHLVGRIAPPQ